LKGKVRSKRPRCICFRFLNITEVLCSYAVELTAVENPANTK